MSSRVSVQERGRRVGLLQPVDRGFARNSSAAAPSLPLHLAS